MVRKKSLNTFSLAANILKMLFIHKIVINMLRIQYDPHSFIIPWSNVEIKMEANRKHNILRLVLSKQMVAWWLEKCEVKPLQ